MCLPLAAAAGIAAAAGSLVNGVQGMMAATYESNVAKRNAQLEIDRARDSVERGREEARDFYRNVGQVKGQQAAALAANGLDVGYGTALTLQQDTARGADEDATNLYRNINERTRGFEINASNYRAEARAARQRGRAALVSSVFQGAQSIMGGFQQQAGMRARLGIGGAIKKASGGSINAPWYVGL